MAVVDRFEVVEIEHHQRDRRLRAGRTRQLGAQPRVKVPPIRHAGQLVRERLLAQLRVRIGQRGQLREPRNELRLARRKRGSVALAPQIQRPDHLVAHDQRNEHDREACEGNWRRNRRAASLASCWSRPMKSTPSPAARRQVRSSAGASTRHGSHQDAHTS
jgi:hypothetical protein